MFSITLVILCNKIILFIYMKILIERNELRITNIRRNFSSFLIILIYFFHVHPAYFLYIPHGIDFL